MNRNRPVTLYLSKSLSVEVPRIVQIPLQWIAALLVPFFLHYLFLYAFHNPYVRFELNPLFFWLLGPAFGCALASLMISLVPVGKYRRRGIFFLSLLGLALFSYINHSSAAAFYSSSMLFLSLGLGLFLRFAYAFPDGNYPS